MSAAANVPETHLAAVNAYVDNLTALTDSGLVPDGMRSWKLQRTYAAPRDLLRTTLHYDATQEVLTTCHVERWDGTQWREVAVAYTPGTHDNYVNDARRPEKAEEDANTIEASVLHDAAAILALA